MPHDTFLNLLPPYTFIREVVRRQPYGAMSDVWALGCLMITILTGQPPFQVGPRLLLAEFLLNLSLQGKTVEDTFRRVSNADFTLPDSLSHEAKDLIQGLLHIVSEIFPESSKSLTPFIVES